MEWLNTIFSYTYFHSHIVELQFQIKLPQVLNKVIDWPIIKTKYSTEQKVPPPDY